MADFQGDHDPSASTNMAEPTNRIALFIPDCPIWRNRPAYFVPENWHREHRKSCLREGDVLVVQTGDIGQVASVPKEYVGANCHALIIISPRSEVCCGVFLAWVLNSNYGHHSLKSIQTGALHPHLNCTFVRDVCIPLPSVKEQNRIVQNIESQLSRMNRFTEGIALQISKLREYRQTLISAAVTGKIDLREDKHGDAH